MKPLLFEKVLKISQEIASASAATDDKQRELAYKKLQELCEKSQGSNKDHPFQWEVLADFTNDGDIAIDIYQIALDKAAKKSLNNYSDELPTLSYKTKEGLFLSISSVNPDAKGESWVIINSESVGPKSKKSE